MDEKPLYGIWMPGKGWLRAQRTDGTAQPYADTKRYVAVYYARLMGGQVRYIDNALADMERVILEREAQRRPVWRIWMNLFGKLRK